MRNVFRRIAGRLVSLPVAATALLVACGEKSVTGENGTPARDARPTLAIRDARSGGSPGFFFLPPIAPALAAYPGTFDPGRSPVIEICAWSGTACAGQVTTFSRAAGTIALDATQQLYRADWPTAGLPPGQLYRVRVLEGVTELGFADAKHPGPGESATSLAAQGIVSLGNATRLAIRFKIQNVPNQPGNQPPVVSITAPATGSVFPLGTPIVFTGTASDPEQGDVSGQIVWRSNRVVGELGTGPTVSATLAGGPHTISASVTDALGATTTVTIGIVVSAVSLPATISVPYTGTATLPITLAVPAPAGGVTFTVTSAAPNNVGVTTATVTIPAGEQSASATLSGLAPGVSTITVSNPDYGSATTTASTSAALNIVQTSVTLVQGGTGSITIELEANGADVPAPAGGVQVALAPASPGCVTVPSTVTIPAGQVSTTATLSYTGTGAGLPCTVTVTASVPAVPAISSDAVTVTVTPAGSLTITTGLRVGAGLREEATVTLGAPAPAGGATVTLTSSDPSRLLLSPQTNDVGQPTLTLTVPENNTSVTFFVHGLESQVGSASVTATAAGYATASGSVAVVPVGFFLSGVDPTLAALGPDDPFVIRVGAVNTGGNGIDEQQVRPGSPGLTFTVSSDNAGVARLVTTAGPGATRTVTVPALQSQTAATVAAGGIAIDPVGPGVATVTAAGSGTTFVPVGATATVTVTGSALTIEPSGLRVGSGLRDEATVVLGVAAPAGGLTVTVTSADPTRLLLSPRDNSVGQASVTLPVLAGNDRVGLYLHGVEGQTGTVVITASAPGFANGTSSVAVVPVGFDLINVPASVGSLAANDEFQVRVGAVNEAGTGVIEQEVRPGSAGLTFTVTNSAAAVAQLVTSAGAGQSRTVGVAALQSRSAATVATGGIAFDPLTAGTTTVTAAGTTGTVFAATPGASRVVTVTGAAISVETGERVGSGLREQISVNLGSSAPVGTVVTLTSADPSRLLISVQANTPGQASATVTTTSATQFLSFWVHGVEGQTGTVAVTASAPGYASGTAPVVVTPVAYEILLASLDVATTTLAANDPFEVRVGALPESGTGLVEQAVRPGATGLTFTVTTSNPAVGQLVTSAGPAASRTVTIAALQSRSPGTVATGGVAFDPLTAGTTTITAAGAGSVFAPQAGASRAVTVTTPVLAVTPNDVRVGSGLRAAISVDLGALAAAATPVTLTSADPSRLLISPRTASAVGQASATVTVAAGSQFANFYVHGIEGQTGTVTVTATAAGYGTGTSAVAVVPIAFDLLLLPATVAATAATDEFQVRVGAVNETSNGLSEQEVRPGSAGLVFTVTNSNGAAAQLVTSAGAGQTRTVTVGPQQSRSPGTLATGGIAFDPLAPGSTVVAAATSSTSNIPLLTSSRSVTVTAAAMLRTARRPALVPDR